MAEAGSCSVRTEDEAIDREPPRSRFCWMAWAAREPTMEAMGLVILNHLPKVKGYFILMVILTIQTVAVQSIPPTLKFSQ